VQSFKRKDLNVYTDRLLAGQKFEAESCTDGRAPNVPVDTDVGHLLLIVISGSLDARAG
jgi:hypothetical protein